jgi:hypothetical protein
VHQAKKWQAHIAPEEQIFNPGANCKKLPSSSQRAKEDVLRYTHTFVSTKRAHKADNDKESASILLSLCAASAALPLSKHQCEPH